LTLMECGTATGQLSSYILWRWLASFMFLFLF
jgi:hypothetical protein